MENNKKTTWQVLSAIDCNEHTKKKNGLTYLSWVQAWGAVKSIYPDANFSVKQFDGKPYLYDENLGYLVATEVTIDGETIPMNLPVMDGANKAQKSTPYTYTTKYGGDKTVEAATMFDINTAIMRCLTKNIAMFGLGHYIYAGEDIPAGEKEEKIGVEVDQELQKKVDACINSDELKVVFDSITNPTKEIKQLFTQKKIQLKNK